MNLLGKQDNNFDYDTPLKPNSIEKANSRLFTKAVEMKTDFESLCAARCDWK